MSVRGEDEGVLRDTASLQSLAAGFNPLPQRGSWAPRVTNRTSAKFSQALLEDKRNKASQ